MKKIFILLLLLLIILYNCKETAESKSNSLFNYTYKDNGSESPTTFDFEAKNDSVAFCIAYKKFIVSKEVEARILLEYHRKTGNKVNSLPYINKVTNFSIIKGDIDITKTIDFHKKDSIMNDIANSIMINR